MNDKINIRNLIFGIIMGLIVILNIFEWINFTIYKKINTKQKKSSRFTSRGLFCSRITTLWINQ